MMFSHLKPSGHNPSDLKASFLVSPKTERRRFLKGLIGLVLSGLSVVLKPLPVLGGWLDSLRAARKGSVASGAPSGSVLPRVVVVCSDAVRTSKGKFKQPQLEKMVNEGLQGVVQAETSELAWKSLFSAGDVVGIKVNSLGGKEIATHPDLVEAIISGLRLAGIPDNNILVWDRLTEELATAGYTIRTGSGVKCFGTDARYDREPEMSGSIGSCFSWIVSSRCSALINVPVLKDHDLAGVSLSMKNFYGAIHNPNKYHDNNCDPYVADVNNHPFIKKKLRLNLCDGLRGLYNGGPAYKPQWSWNFNGILVSRDPVALDRTGLEIIETKRAEKGLPPLAEVGREAKYITTASRLGLGSDDPKRIEKVHVTLA